MRNKKHLSRTIIEYIVSIFIGLTILFLFYWFQYRPSTIHSLCAEQTRATMNNSEISKKDLSRVKIYTDEYYQLCLHRHGL